MVPAPNITPVPQDEAEHPLVEPAAVNNDNDGPPELCDCKPLLDNVDA